MFKIIATTSLAQMYDSFLLYADWPMTDNRPKLHYYAQFVLDLVMTTANSWLSFQAKLKLVEVAKP